ncbi:hypothetical protein LSAT2_007739 [Lamellibrachia satsuma]|nr:hypothetical protein LSAT2_007739 [Lamellibrachia satsuma]
MPLAPLADPWQKVDVQADPDRPSVDDMIVDEHRPVTQVRSVVPFCHLSRTLAVTEFCMCHSDSCRVLCR